MSKYELLIYGLFIAGYLLFNYIVQRAARRARSRKERELAEQQQAAPAREAQSLDYAWGRLPPAAIDLPAIVEPALRTMEAVVPAAPTSKAPAVPRIGLFRNRGDLRHAIVVMTVLGPCRALEPYNER